VDVTELLEEVEARIADKNDAISIKSQEEITFKKDWKDRARDGSTTGPTTEEVEALKELKAGVTGLTRAKIQHLLDYHFANIFILEKQMMEMEPSYVELKTALQFLTTIKEQDQESQESASQASFY
jgi:hypothetical protein